MDAGAKPRSTNQSSARVVRTKIRWWPPAPAVASAWDSKRSPRVLPETRKRWLGCVATQASSTAAGAVGEQRAAADHDAVQLRHREMFDLRLQAVAGPADQQPRLLQGADQFHDAGDVGTRGRPDGAIVFLRDLRADAFRGEELLQEGPVGAVGDQVAARDPGGVRFEQRPQPRLGRRAERALRQRLRQRLRRHVSDVVHPVDLVIDDELVRADTGRHLGGQCLGRQHIGGAGGRVADGRHQHHRTGVEQPAHFFGVHASDFPRA